MIYLNTLGESWGLMPDQYAAVFLGECIYINLLSSICANTVRSFCQIIMILRWAESQHWQKITVSALSLLFDLWQRNGRAQLTYKNGDLYQFANVFMLAWPYGHARVMSSYYFTDSDAGPPSVGVSNGENCRDGKNWVCHELRHRVAVLIADAVTILMQCNDFCFFRCASTDGVRLPTWLPGVMLQALRPRATGRLATAIRSPSVAMVLLSLL